ncbi:MAG: hypothetical protein WCD79_20675 [Chthoniobacteraceae bacterium]
MTPTNNPERRKQPPADVQLCLDTGYGSHTAFGYAATSMADALANAESRLPTVRSMPDNGFLMLGSGGLLPFRVSSIAKQITGADPHSAPPDPTANIIYVVNSILIGQGMWLWISANCYLKIYWTEETWQQVNSATPTLTSTEDKNYEWTGSDLGGGMCISSNGEFPDYPFTPTNGDPPSPLQLNPRADYVQGPAIPYTYPACDDPAVPPDNTTTNTTVAYRQISKFSYSFLPDYIPPDDGSANGYPLP